MGGRGTFASGLENTPFEYKTIGVYHGIKVLEGIGSKHDLPVESHSSPAYAKLFKDGSIQMIRFYDSNKFLYLEIGYHPEPKLTGHSRPIYHAHDYTQSFQRSSARFLTDDEKNNYKEFFDVKGAFK